MFGCCSLPNSSSGMCLFLPPLLSSPSPSSQAQPWHLQSLPAAEKPNFMHEALNQATGKPLNNHTRAICCHSINSPFSLSIRFHLKQLPRLLLLCTAHKYTVHTCCYTAPRDVRVAGKPFCPALSRVALTCGSSALQWRSDSGCELNSKMQGKRGRTSRPWASALCTHHRPRGQLPRWTQSHLFWPSLTSAEWCFLGQHWH